VTYPFFMVIVMFKTILGIVTACIPYVHVFGTIIIVYFVQRMFELKQLEF
jgi:hypothetical protein